MFCFSFSNVNGLIEGTVDGTLELPDGDAPSVGDRWAGATSCCARRTPVTVQHGAEFAL